MKKIYFASDFHLGIDAATSSSERERALVRWLDQIGKDAGELYLVGDIFDFWFEYKTVIPRGYARFLGKLAELRDAGLPIYFFTGNHDMWMFGYFEEEFGIPVYRKSIIREWNGKKFMIGHGDGLGPGDHGYKRLKKIFAHPVCQWLFARLHPNFGIGLANYWSQKSRSVKWPKSRFYGEERERLLAYAQRKSENLPDIDYFLFGHRHMPIDHVLKNGKSRYINLGEWLTVNSYVVFDGEEVEIKFFENDEGKIYGNRGSEEVGESKSRGVKESEKTRSSS